VNSHQHTNEQSASIVKKIHAKDIQINETEFK